MTLDLKTARKQLEVSAEEAARLIQPAIPFATHALVSVTAFSCGLAATQAAAFALRISCATPVLGPGLGALGVAAASAAAGEASLRCRRYFQYGVSPWQPSKRPAQDMALDAFMGMFLYKMLGGRFRSVMPSDLFKPGAMARESLPCPGSSYANHVGRLELRRLMQRDGCHHCGKRAAAAIGDHIPPNKLIAPASAVEKRLARRMQHSWLTGELPRLVARWADRTLPQAASALLRPGQVQRYYPQCRACSQKQAAAVKAGKRMLVAHWGGPRPWYYAGIFVGLRHYQAPPVAGSGSPRHRGDGRHFSAWQWW